MSRVIQSNESICKGSACHVEGARNPLAGVLEDRQQGSRCQACCKTARRPWLEYRQRTMVCVRKSLVGVTSASPVVHSPLRRIIAEQAAIGGWWRVWC